MKREWERAARSGDAAAILQSLGAGDDPDARDRYGQTALMLASHAGHLEVVRLLVAHGARMDITGKYGLSALMLAVVGGHEEVARALALAGADRSLRGTGAPGFHGKTAFDLAAERRLSDALRAELDRDR